MKKIILTLGISLLAQAAFAQGTLVGACLVKNYEGEKTYTFSAGPNEKYRLGIEDEENGDRYQVSIVNNINNKNAEENWGHTVLISMSTLIRYFANPPNLCESGPRGAACALDNEMRASYGARFNKFSPLYNVGYADAEVVSDAHYFPLTQLVDGTPLVTPIQKLGKNITVLCQAGFIK
jgi:hypothetical protein